MSKTTARTDRFDSAWDALADSTEDTANLKMRADLMRKIAALIHDKTLNAGSGCRTLRHQSAAPQ